MTTNPKTEKTAKAPKRRPNATERRTKSCILLMADLVQAQIGIMPSEQRSRAEPFLAEAGKLRKGR